jgi:acyl-CoA synthetase (AMP-forming)/AMP-acid ligase II
VVVDLVAARVLAQSGLLRPARPDRLLGMALSVARWGVTLATGYAAGAARHPLREALVDDDGSLSWRDIDRRTGRIAGELRARGVGEGDAVGLLARNGRGFVETATALAKCGADVLYLNTGSAGSVLADVLRREDALGVVYDAEFGDLLAEAARGRLALTTEELGRLATRPGPKAPLRPSHTSRQVILTSGTTGAPRGAARSGAGIRDAVSVLSRIPLRAGGTTVIAAPVFHAWGLGHLSLGMLLGSTVVLRRRFDPEQVLADIEAHRATALILVPVMLEKLLAADPSTYDLSSLRVIAASGSALPGELAERTLAAFGPVLYNLYGSTEVAYAAVATPGDLLADPHTAGRPPHGVTLRVVDDEDRELPPGEAGRIFVANGLAFDGYTDGSDRDRLGGLVATGDLGVIDEDGRLTVLGRTDDMIVVGGENVYVGQVEDVLLAHPGVREVAVVGEEDRTYGARLVAHVVLDAPVDTAELQDWVATRLARFAMPREVKVYDELPRNSTGKVLKRELRDATP